MMVIISFAQYIGISWLSRTFEKLMLKSGKTGQVQVGLWVTHGLILKVMFQLTFGNDI